MALTDIKSSHVCMYVCMSVSIYVQSVDIPELNHMHMRSYDPENLYMHGSLFYGTLQCKLQFLYCVSH